MRKLKVKLITVPWELEVPTLSLACLAAVTPESRFEVAVVDALRHRVHVDEPVDLVGITASTPAIKGAYALADQFRARGVPVVFGGHHVTAMPKEGLLHGDAVVVGEGETAWTKILEDVASNPKRVQGVYREPAPDLDTLPVPSVKHLTLERHGPYNYPIIASRGCPEVCSFCFAKRMSRGFRTYPVARVLEQIRMRPEWAKMLYFVDDNLAGDRDYAKELFRAMSREKNKIHFGMQVRSEFADDEEMLRLAYEAGCAFVSSGYESVNQHTLDSQRKRAAVADYKRRIKAIQREGMIASGNFMFGFDGDDLSTFDRTLDFLDEAGIYHATFTTEIPFPGTGPYRKYEKEGRLLTRDYDAYVGKDHVVVKPALMSARELRDGVRRISLSFFSPRRAAARAAAAYDNKKLFMELSGGQRMAAIVALSAYQVYQWHYRMTSTGYWLYRKLLPYAKYAYPEEWTSTTNFRPLAA
ncbi:MAG: radical SAM protein [Polyangiaceae bacterium]